MNERLKMRIQGMDCPDCAAKIENIVARLPGVAGVSVNFIGQVLSAQADSPEAAQRIREAIKQLGYVVDNSANHERMISVLQVKGMDCSEEKALVEKVLTGVSGMEHFEVNLMSQRLRITHDPNILPLSRIVRVLGDVGLSAMPFGATQPTAGFWMHHGREISTGMAGLFTGIGLVLHFHDVVGAWEVAAYSVAIICGGWLVARKGVAAARHRSLDMNFLMMVAVVGAVGIGAWDEGAMVVFLFSLAQMLEGRAMDRARDSVKSLMDLSSPAARLLRDGNEVMVPVDEVNVGDVFRLRPGEKIPLDGEVIDGRSAVNQAPITGESVPVDRRAGDIVYAGSINSQGSLDVRITHKASDSTLAHIIHLIEEAQAARAPSQTFIDHFARIYTPAVLVLAVLIAILPPLLPGQLFAEWFYRALVLLVIACPCALVISTPVAIVSGLARGARDGILIKGGAHLENAGHIKALALDKTGTLTEGLPRVQDIELLNETPGKELIRIAASLEARSEHPLAQAIRDYAHQAGIEPEPLSEFQALTGLGVQGRLHGQDFLLGNHRLFEERELCTPEVEAVLDRHEAAGKTVMILGNTRQVMGLIAVADHLRSEAPATINALRRLGIEYITMLTGDNRRTAQAIGRDLDIDDVQAELLPADKVEAVKRLVEQYDKVGMVGDGVNDAPAMAAATTGIAMGAAGSDAALEVADLILMGDDLAKLPLAIRLSRATLGVIRQNIFLSLLIKAVFLVLALLGYATLWMAVFADMGASLIVIANSLRLLRLKG